MKLKLATAGVLLSATLVAGCADIEMKQMAPGEAPVVMGPAVRSNSTPLENAFSCYADELRQRRAPRVAIAVGDVKDYTGKYNESEGSAITQGGALMVYSALGKLGDSVLVQERFDTRIAELELAYIDRRQLGDGRQHVVGGGNQAPVPWVPYFGGSILRSNYYIVGGITELNYNIQSGGAEFTVSQIGPKARVFTMNVGIDLRIIDTQTLVVRKTSSLQKQITGFEIGFNVFRFFNNDLFDVNIGNKSQEPVQLGVRIALEQATLDLMQAVTGVDEVPCVERALMNGSYSPPPPPQAQAPVQPAAMAPAAGPVVYQAAAVQNVASISGAPRVQVPFEFNAVGISGGATPAIGSIVAASTGGNAVNVEIIGRDSEAWAPLKRDEIIKQRIQAVTDALVARGVSSSRIRVTWMPAISDTGMRRDGAGYQIFATMVVTKS